MAQFVEQCTECGHAVSTPIKKSAIRNPDKTPPWDEALQKAFEHLRNLDNVAQRKADRQAFFAEHDVYLRSPAWRARRQAVLFRARGRCEGCGLSDATQVHHLTYDHWKEEFLWELVAICDLCHDRVHAEREKGPQ